MTSQSCVSSIPKMMNFFPLGNNLMDFYISKYPFVCHGKTNIKWTGSQLQCDISRYFHMIHKPCPVSFNSSSNTTCYTYTMYIKTRISNKRGFVWGYRPLRVNRNARKFLFFYIRLQPTTRKTVTFKEIFASNIPIYCIHATVPVLPYIILNFGKPLLSGQLVHSRG